MSKRYLNSRPIAQILNEVEIGVKPYKSGEFLFEGKRQFSPIIELQTDRGGYPADLVNMTLSELFDHKRTDYQIHLKNGSIISIYLIRDKKTGVINVAEGIKVIFHIDSFGNYTAQYKYHPDVRFRLSKLQEAWDEKIVDGMNFHAWLLDPHKRDKKPFGYNFYRSKNKK